jgi:acyl-CoA synthetase (AMP-forming)/AMP-acid ligase II
VAVVRAAATDDLADFDLRCRSLGARAAPRDGWLPRADARRRPVGASVNYFTTSGSTGMPKLAGHDQASVATHGVNVAAALDMRAGDRLLGVLPLSGVFGFKQVIAMLSVGGACLLEPTFDPSQALDDADVQGITHMIGGDDMLGRLMDAWHARPPGERPTLSGFRRGPIPDFAGRVGAVVDWAGGVLLAADIAAVGSSSRPSRFPRT